MKLFLILVLASCSLLFAGVARAVPADYTLNIQSVSVPDNDAAFFRLLGSCNLATQTATNLLLDPVSSGDSYQWVGDTDNAYTFCVRGYNVDSQGAAFVGGFANVITIPSQAVTLPPGDGTLTVTCDSVPIGGGAAICEVVVNP